MKRRLFMTAAGAAVLLPTLFGRIGTAQTSEQKAAPPVARSDDEWRELLSDEQYDVLRREGTEAPGSSPLNHEKRAGTYTCAGCGQPLFESDTKYDSGTGWPSFFAAIDGAVETKTDYKLIWPRTEYHCSHCGGHQGHIFKDGPQPTGLRYCNNGVALRFIPAGD